MARSMPKPSLPPLRACVGRRCPYSHQERLRAAALIEAAFASVGTPGGKASGRSPPVTNLIKYKSDVEMARALAALDSEIAAMTSGPRPSTIRFSTSKGL